MTTSFAPAPKLTTREKVERWGCHGGSPQLPPLVDLFRGSLWPKFDRGFACVYIVRCGRFVKIGATGADVDRRVHAIQVYNPHPVKMWLAIPRRGWSGAYDLEQFLHKKFSHAAHRGEWFKIDARLVDFVRRARRGIRAGKGVVAL